jgi:aminopeptidase N
MNEPHMAPWWFPSDDHPADKATFDVAITTDAGLQVISNGTEGSRTVNGAHATTRWHEDEPMATYLAFFAAGHFLVSHGTTDGIPWTTAVSRGYSRARQRHYRALLGQSGAITAWLQHELGPYPFDSIGGLVTRLDPGFALENQTRPTYPWWVDHSTVVHELAHQWFGDSVSLRRWRDVWLNEGFATYMEQRWREDHGGPTTRQWLHAAYRALAGDHAFWQIPVASPGVDDIWSNAVYVRGAMTLAALRVRIGSQDFRTLLRTWVAEHRYGNGIIPQFEALAHRVSGQRLDGFFRAWLLDREPPARTAANGW